jgi:hypothetical protein
VHRGRDRRRVVDYAQIAGCEEFSMYVAPNSPRHLNEQRRYFPDWTERLPEIPSELEADHNSYSACGYAEEFGYRAQPGYSRGILLIDGEVPELCSERYAQARATHPGYPLKPRPVAGELDVPADAYVHEVSSVREPQDSGRHGGIIVVSNRLRVSKRHAVARKVVLLSFQLTSAVILLRWLFGRRHRV